MFTDLKHMFTALELMFIDRKHNFSRCKDTFSFRFHQIKLLQFLKKQQVSDKNYNFYCFLINV